jgi:hypothetical protein
MYNVEILTDNGDNILLAQMDSYEWDNLLDAKRCKEIFIRSYPDGNIAVVDMAKVVFIQAHSLKK